MRESLKTNDKVNPVADGSATTSETLDRNSGSTDCSFSAIGDSDVLKNHLENMRIREEMNKVIDEEIKLRCKLFHDAMSHSDRELRFEAAIATLILSSPKPVLDTIDDVMFEMCGNLPEGTNLETWNGVSATLAKYRAC